MIKVKNPKLSVKLLKISLGGLMAIFLLFFVLIFMKDTVISYFGTIVDTKIFYNDDNIQNWGNFTDDNTVKVYNKIRYYSVNTELSNSERFVVQELPEVSFRSMYKAYNVTYFDDGNRVGYDREVTPVLDSPVKSFKGKIINFLGVTFWYRVKNLPIEDRAFTALASITTGIGLTIEKQLDSVFLFRVFDKLGEYIVRFFLTKNLNIPSQTAHLMITDPYFGFRTQGGINQWLDTYHNANTMKLISDYFDIDIIEVFKAMNNLSGIIGIAHQYLQYEISCNNDCDSYNYLVRQFANSEISKPLSKSPTLADGETLFGLPEYNAFYLDRFAKQPGFENSALTIEQAKKLLNIDLKEQDYSKDWDNLIHKGNIYDIFKAGKQYDEYKDKNYLEPLVARFGLKNVEQAIVLYEYLKYLGDEFITSKASGGNIEITTFTALYAEYVKKLFTSLIDFFSSEFLPYFFVNFALKEHNASCLDIFKDSIVGLTDDEINSLCKPYTDATQLFNALYSYCELNEMSLFNLNYNHRTELCRTPNNKVASYALIKSAMRLSLKTYFGAFSPIQLSFFQFVEAKVTKVDCPYTKERYPVAESISDWSKEKFRTRFEVYLIAKDTNADFNLLKNYTVDNFKGLMNDNRLYSQPVINMAVINNRNNKTAYYDKMFGLGYPEFFESYIKTFVKIFILGGDYLEINEKHASEGIPLQIFSDLKNKKVILGGDPSIDEKFNLVKVASGYTIKTTGKSNIKELDNFKVINNLSIANVPLPAFNGNQTYTNYNQPWKEETEVSGCELFCEVYDKDESSVNPNKYKYDDLSDKHISYYQDAIARTLNMNYSSHRTVNEGNFIINKFKLDNNQLSTSEENAIYYQYKYNGFFNMTTVVGGPFFMSKNRFLDVQQSITENIEILNENGEPAAPRPEIDDIFFEIERFTNACVTNNVNLQLNLQVEKNEMFKYSENSDILYPILNIYGYQKMEDNFLSVKFNDLLPVNKIANGYYTYLFIILLIIALIAVGVFLWIKKINNDDHYDYVEEGPRTETLINN